MDETSKPPCSKCGKPWSKDDFYSSPGNCKECRKEYARKYHADNRDAARARKKLWEKSNPDKARAIKRHKAQRRRKNNPGKVKALEKEKRIRQREKDPSGYRKKKRDRESRNRAKNPDRAKAKDIAKTARRRSRKQGAMGGHTRAEISDLFARQSGRCAACNAKLTISRGPKQRNLDHVQPLAAGGSNSVENLQWLCADCNNKKGAMDPYEWARLHGKLFA